MNFVTLDHNSARIVVIKDASFGNSKGLQRKLGFLVLLCYKNGKENILNYGSSRCNRVKRSVIAAEIQALVMDLDYAFVIRDIVGEILSKRIALEAYVDSETVLEVVEDDVDGRG